MNWLVLINCLNMDLMIYANMVYSNSLCILEMTNMCSYNKVKAYQEYI